MSKLVCPRCAHPWSTLVDDCPRCGASIRARLWVGPSPDVDAEAHAEALLRLGIVSFTDDRRALSAHLRSGRIRVWTGAPSQAGALAQHLVERGLSPNLELDADPAKGAIRWPSLRAGFARFRLPRLDGTTVGRFVLVALICLAAIVAGLQAWSPAVDTPGRAETEALLVDSDPVPPMKGQEAVAGALVHFEGYAGVGFAVSRPQYVLTTQDVLPEAEVGRRFEGKSVLDRTARQLVVRGVDPPSGFVFLEVSPPLASAMTMKGILGARGGERAVQAVGSWGKGVAHGLLFEELWLFGRRVLYRTDLRLQPAMNSGPLLDEEGRVLGVLVGYGRERFPMGFAVPIEFAASRGRRLLPSVDLFPEVDKSVLADAALGARQPPDRWRRPLMRIHQAYAGRSGYALRVSYFVDLGGQMPPGDFRIRTDRRRSPRSKRRPVDVELEFERAISGRTERVFEIWGADRDLLDVRAHLSYGQGGQSYPFRFTSPTKAVEEALVRRFGRGPRP